MDVERERLAGVLRMPDNLTIEYFRPYIAGTPSLHRLRIRVNEPVLGDSHVLIQSALHHPVEPCGARGQDFDCDECPCHRILEGSSSAIDCRNDINVWLQQSIRYRPQIGWADSNLSQIMLFDVRV